MQRIILQPGFILHARPYRDSSLLLDILSRDHGRLTLMARGVKKKNKTGQFLQAFTPFVFSWQGKSELMNLTVAEPQGVPIWLMGTALVCGLYLNEILIRLLHPHDPHPSIYELYAATLNYLSQSVNIPTVLRLFEKHLLAELGYGLSLSHDTRGLSISPEADYYYLSGRGFERVVSSTDAQSRKHFSGESLIALREERLTSPVVLQEIKRLMQLALAPLLGEKPLKSRECFI